MGALTRRVRRRHPGGPAHRPRRTAPLRAGAAGGSGPGVGVCRRQGTKKIRRGQDGARIRGLPGRVAREPRPGSGGSLRDVARGLKRIPSGRCASFVPPDGRGGPRQYLAGTFTCFSPPARPCSASSRRFMDSTATSSSARRGSVVVRYLWKKFPTDMEGGGWAEEKKGPGEGGELKKGEAPPPL